MEKNLARNSMDTYFKKIKKWDYNFFKLWCLSEDEVDQRKLIYYIMREMSSTYEARSKPSFLKGQNAYNNSLMISVHIISLFVASN